MRKLQVAVGVALAVLVSGATPSCSDGQDSGARRTSTSVPTLRPGDTVTPGASPSAPPVGRYVVRVTGPAPGYDRRLLGLSAGAIDWSNSLGEGVRLLGTLATHVLLADGGTLRRIDGRTGVEDSPLVRRDHEVLEAAVSPDEKLVAFTTYPGAGCAANCAGADGGSLVVVDAQTGRVQLELHADDVRFRDSLGSPGTVHWLSNSSFMLVMSRFSSSLGSTYAIDLPNGRTTKLPRTPLLVEGRSHVGVYFADPPKRVGCYDWAALEGADLVTGAVLFSVGGAGSGLNPVEFSPDGREVLVVASKWPPGTPESCAAPPLESRLFFVVAATGATQDVSDADALRRAWYGAAFLSWSCPPGLSDRRGNSSFSCNGAGELTLGGTVIPASNARVVAFAE